MSRFDDVGMWWQDYKPPPTANKAAVRVTNVDIPSTGWSPPTDFPNLSGCKVLGIDTETKDPNLLSKGPGGVRKDGHIVGVSVSTTDRSWYFPMRHEHPSQRSLNMNPDSVLAFVRDIYQSAVPLVGANLLYDLEWLRAEGAGMPKGELFDVQYAEPLLDEESRSYSLDSLASKYLGTGKVTSALYEWCAASFGGDANGKQRANIWRSPPSLVGPYAEADAGLPLKILAQQRKLLAQQELTDLFRIECALIPLLLDMRFFGVRIDMDKAHSTLAWLRAEAAKHQSIVGDVDVWSSDSVARAFDKANVEYPRTEAGNPSFTRPWLETCPHEVAQAILGVRMYEKAANPFIESYLLGSQVNGRVHCQFHPLRSDDYGTVSGRFSSSNPNLQNIPSRDKVLGPMLRSLFIPEDGCKWRRADYSQVEYRLLAHYAVGNGADALRKKYIDDPRADFHIMTLDMVREQTGVELGRKPAKNLNFGLVYGMGKDKTARSLGVPYDLGLRLYDAYFEAMPMVKATYKSAERLAKRRGYIKTVLGRRRRFKDEQGLHKALNACLQGSAADVIKKAMVTCYKEGIFAKTGIPHLTVHDELDWSDNGDAAAFEEAKHVLETCVPLRVPLLVDMSVGNTWGDCA